MTTPKPLSLNERNDRLLDDISCQQSCSMKNPNDHRPPAQAPSEQNPIKVRLEGRRRLCKIQSETLIEPSQDPTASPVPQIRDILNDLSSRLETLSIEKKKPSKTPFSSFSLLSDSDSASSSIERTETESQVPENKQKKEKAISPLRWSLVSEDEGDCAAVRGKTKDNEAPPLRNDRIDIDDSEDEVEGLDSVDEHDEHTVRLSSVSSTYTLPGKIAKMLYPHQREGLNWLWALHCKPSGGILGDDMGLGKTMQISAFLAGLFHSNLIKRALIVAPKTLLAHWIKELSVVGLSEKTREYFATSVKTRQYELQYILQDKGVLLTTYDIVRTSSKSLCGDSYLHDDESEDNTIWDYIILDEGHIIKNPSTQRAKSLLDIPSRHRIIISGTPIQNNLKELWALFNFCCPELLGDKKEFKERYEYAILRGNDKNAYDREKRIGSMVAKELRDRIKPYFLRRLKSEVFAESEETESRKLSKKHELIVWLRLTQCQRQLYEAFLKSELVLSSFDGSPLAALTILKKICDHPFLLTKKAAEDVLEGMDTMSNRDLDMAEKMASHLASLTTLEESHQVQDVSCKITFILSLLENLVTAGHNVLIFSQTRKMLNLIQEAIVMKGYLYLRIDGTTKACDREKIVKDFQEGEGAPIFLLTSQVGGLGLTLTKADRVIVVDPAWNPSTDNQSVDRAYRIGQTKDVVVYRLMTCSTIEEKIYRMQIFKGGLFKTATEHKEQTRYFSQRDLRELFSLPEQGFDISLTQQQMHKEHDYLHTMYNTKRDETLKNHIMFLESQGIGGVSHHSLLFSKTAPTPLVLHDEMLLREKANMRFGHPLSSSSMERNVDGAEYAFNPKDKDHQRKDVSVGPTSEAKDEEIRKRIGRLRLTLANKDVVSQLPDKGERIRRQIDELNLQLQKIYNSHRKDAEIIDLDDISGRLEKLRTD